MKRMSVHFLRSSLILSVCFLSLLSVGILTPADAHAFGSLGENGTAAFMGIGIAPQKILHVSGSGAGSVPLFQRGSDSAGFIIERTSTNRWVLGVNESPTLGTGFVLSTIPAGTQSVPRLVVSQAGNVGIPTVDSGRQLNVVTSNTYAIYGSKESGSYGWIGSANYGVKGVSGTIGVEGVGTGSATGVHGSSTTGYAGEFSGPVYVSGFITKAGGGFQIDHPQAPESKYLVHSFVESPDMKNVYDGTVELDAVGGATVQLPAYFESLNRDFRYQLTAIGAPGPNLYISSEIAGNSFSIAGGSPGMKVSWQVTGIRKDVFANAHPIIAEKEKPAKEQGLYMHPIEWGQPAEKGINYRPPE